MRIQSNGKEVQIETVEFCKKLGVFGIIRVFEKEFGDIEFTDGLYGHFNLAETGHVVGEKYTLVKIIRAGVSSDNPELEVEPLLSIEGAYIVECVEVRNNIPFDKLDATYFAHPMRGVTNSKVLVDRIYKRYSLSRPGLTRELVQRMGVGYTVLRYVKGVEL